jgi:hypothetical protein
MILDVLPRVQEYGEVARFLFDLLMIECENSNTEM